MYCSKYVCNKSKSYATQDCDTVTLSITLNNTCYNIQDHFCDFICCYGNSQAGAEVTRHDND